MNRQPGWLGDHQPVVRFGQNIEIKGRRILKINVQRPGWSGPLRGNLGKRRQADDLALGQPVKGLGPFSIDTDLAGAYPAHEDRAGHILA
jgi:hypothetical protein